MNWSLLLLLVISACGGPQGDPAKVGEIVNTSPDVTNEEVQTVVDTFRALLLEPELDASQIKIIVQDNTGCPGTDACTTRGLGGDNWIIIRTPWRYNAHANIELLAHELCHAVYIENMPGTGDPDHEEHACFARRSGQYAAFEGEIGVANEVADILTGTF